MKKVFMVFLATIMFFNINVFAQDVLTVYNNPDDLTRGMAVQMIYELAGSPATDEAAPFSDGHGKWENAINWAYEKGIFLGFEDGTCRPDQLITKEQFAVMLSRLYEAPTVSGNLIRYEDRNMISDWAENALHWCLSYDIIDLDGNIIAPSTSITTKDAKLMMDNINALPDFAQMKTDLAILTENPHPSNSDFGDEVSNYIADRFEKLGYKVNTQPYIADGVSKGCNVIAAINVGCSDVFVISAHHDSVPTSFGANDNASGVAGLLLLAERLADVKSDTELRFISFTDEEDGKNGSRQYVESLSEAEKEKIVGCIQLDMLGGLGTDGISVCTTDGSANWLTDLLQKQNEILNIGQEDASDHAMFQLVGVPSVLITQNGRGYLYHTIGDEAQNLNLMEIYKAADIVEKAVLYIADTDTPSYREFVQNEKNSYIYSHTRQSKILFAEPRSENEACLGVSGELIKQWDENGEGWSDHYEIYSYNMKWFGGAEPMTTHYTYRNGYLDIVNIYPNENSYKADELRLLISKTHGTPCREDKLSSQWDWQDELYGKYISLEEKNDDIVISVYPYSNGLGNTMAAYTCIEGKATVENLQHKKVWDLLCTFLPIEYRQRIGELRIFTDGFSNILAYATTMGTSENPDNSQFAIVVDYYDVYDENGNARDQSKLIYTLVHEYGHTLLENDTQIDTSVDTNIHKPETFIEGSFRKRYYDEFWRNVYSSFLGDYKENPENYVSEYAGSLFHEDIADTFAVFVLGAKPDGNSVAEQKILFFWQDDSLVSLRRDIRKGLGLNCNM